MPAENSSPQVPKIDRNMLRVFRWFVRGYVRKRFHALAVNASALDGADFQADDSLVVYANHASWWDPLTAVILADCYFRSFGLYAPIDAQALAKYKMFARLGFFGVDQHSLHGAGEFLRISRQILATPRSSIWITPEGRFVDVRDREANFNPGLAHLAAALSRSSQRGDELAGRRVWFVPGAVEYVYWEEPQPELLCWIGEPLLVAGPAGAESLVTCQSKAEWNQLLQERLRNAQAALAEASIRRDSKSFDVLLGGASGTFFLYDWWRKGMSVLRGQRMNVEHSDKLQAGEKSKTK
jgi:1-acyl-sn-glycerol-3-phosphate acyltransferase